MSKRRKSRAYCRLQGFTDLLLALYTSKRWIVVAGRHGLIGDIVTQRPSKDAEKLSS